MAARSDDADQDRAVRIEYEAKWSRSKLGWRALVEVRRSETSLGRLRSLSTLLSWHRETFDRLRQP